MCPPPQCVQHISYFVCFALEDCPDNDFFNQVLPFLPVDLCGACMLHKQSNVVEKCCFSSDLCQEIDGEWHRSVTNSASNAPTNLITIQDSSNPNCLDASKVPNCDLMDSNQGAKDSSQDSKCTKLDSHMRQLSPMADWGHTGLGTLSLTQPNPNSTQLRATLCN